MLQRCLDNQRPVVDKLNAKVTSAVERSGQSTSPLSSKLNEMNDTYRQVQQLAQQRRNELIDKLQQVSDKLGDSDRLFAKTRVIRPTSFKISLNRWQKLDNIFRTEGTMDSEP